MTYLANKDYGLEVARHRVADIDHIHRFALNPNFSTADGEVVVWPGDGLYSGFDATAGEQISFSSTTAQDSGTLLSSGTATGGTATTIVDSGADFIADGVSVGDVVVNDDLNDHGIITNVATTTLTVFRFQFNTIPVTTNAYRVATVTPTNTGTAVLRVTSILDVNYAEHIEYIIMNGITVVNTVGTNYIRASSARCILSGSDDSNNGVIVGTQSTTTANVFINIPANYGIAVSAVWTVPAGKVGRLRDWFAATAEKDSANCTVRLCARNYGESMVVREERSIKSGGTSITSRTYSIPHETLEAGTDVFIAVSTDTNNTRVTAGFTVYVELL